VKALFSLLSPAGAGARLSILIFHRVLSEPDPLFPDEVDAARFDQQLGWLKRWFQVLPLDEAARRLTEGSLPARAAALTFDDGYADNHGLALPLLRRHGLPCTFFIATGFLDGGRMWNDSLIEAVRRSTLPGLDLRGLSGRQGQDLGRHELGALPQQRRALIDVLLPQVKYLAPEPRLRLVEQIAQRAEVALPDNLMMSTAQVRDLHAAGMQIGAHTRSHPILASLSETEARDEIAYSKRTLEQMLGAPVGLFAYPNGRPGTDYLPQCHPAMVRELGFQAAVSTHWGAARAGSDVFQLPRFTPWDRSRLRYGARMLRNLRA